MAGNQPPVNVLQFFRGRSAEEKAAIKPASQYSLPADSVGVFASQTNGLQRILQRNSMLSDAITDPGAYFRQREAKLLAIREKTDENFKSKYEELLAEAVAEPIARASALDFATHIQDYELKQLDISMPENITAFAIDNQARRTYAGLPGIPGSHAGGGHGRKRASKKK